MAQPPVHQGLLLKKKIEESGRTVEEIAQKANLHRTTLYNYFDQEEILRKKLQPLCDILEIDINEFYRVESSKAVHEIKAVYTTVQMELAALRQKVKDQEIIIEQQKEIIELLKRNQKTKK